MHMWFHSSYPTHTKYLEWYLTFIYQKNYSFFVTIFYSRHQRVQLVMGFDIWVSTFVQQIPRIYAKEKSSIMFSNKINNSCHCVGTKLFGCAIGKLKLLGWFYISSLKGKSESDQNIFFWNLLDDIKAGRQFSLLSAVIRKTSCKNKTSDSM